MAGAGGHTFLAYADAVRGSARRNRDGRVLRRGCHLGRNRRSGGLFGRSCRIGRCLVGDLLAAPARVSLRDGRRASSGMQEAWQEELQVPLPGPVGVTSGASSGDSSGGARGTGHLLGRFGRHLWRLFGRGCRVRQASPRERPPVAPRVRAAGEGVSSGASGASSPSPRMSPLPRRLRSSPDVSSGSSEVSVRPILGRGFRGSLRRPAPAPAPARSRRAAHGRPGASSTASRTPRSRRRPAAGRRPARSGSRR